MVLALNQKLTGPILMIWEAQMHQFHGIRLHLRSVKNHLGSKQGRNQSPEKKALQRFVTLSLKIKSGNHCQDKAIDTHFGFDIDCGPITCVDNLF